MIDIEHLNVAGLHAALKVAVGETHQQATRTILWEWNLRDEYVERLERVAAGYGVDEMLTQVRLQQAQELRDRGMVRPSWMLNDEAEAAEELEVERWLESR